jgi:LysR family transcriptional regulator, repressor for citA
MMESVAKKFLKEGLLVEVKFLESTPLSMGSYILLNRQRINSESVSLWP